MSTTERGSATGSWWRLGRDGWQSVLGSAAQEFTRDELPTFAGQVTLRIVLALVPSLIAGVAIAAQLVDPADIEELVGSADDLIPGENAQAFVQTQLQNALGELRDGGPWAIALSILVGLFAATGAAAALINALNKAYGVEEARGIVSQRVAALVVVAALGLSLAGMFIAIVLGPTLIGWLVPDRLMEPPLRWLITAGRYAVAVVILMGFFGFTFWFAPHRERHRIRFLTPGAVVGVIGWLVLSWLFGLYVTFTRTYAETYGSVAGVIVLLVWLNYSFMLLLAAAELDHEIERHLDRAEQADPAPAATRTRLRAARRGKMGAGRSG
ncbi:YihY/virulence factor BrkB family protein [Euzebya sp.]|uniref:YihY/virulence factor BrkB family protein n=1 Tax=Euzebya sp. TaxID=1971409 RepID=UPI003515CED9